MPVPTLTSVPTVSRADRVMMLITPFMAFDPYSAPPGPLITSIRSMSSSIRSRASQNTPELRVEYRLRPSTMTSSLLEVS